MGNVKRFLENATVQRSFTNRLSEELRTRTYGGRVESIVLRVVVMETYNVSRTSTDARCECTSCVRMR